MPFRLWRRPLDADQIVATKSEVFVVADRCNGCGFCYDFCPKDVLTRSEKMNKNGVYPPKVVDENKCISCGYCRSICPTCAIFIKEKGLPKEV